MSGTVFSSPGLPLPHNQTQRGAEGGADAILLSWFSREIPSRLCGLGVRPVFEHVFVQEMEVYSW